MSDGSTLNRTPRPITPEEVAVIRAAFTQGQIVREVLPAALEDLPSLTVVSQCACGCASIDFGDDPPAGPRSTLVADAVANDRWSMDFTLDTLASGRRFRTLNIVDDFTRECQAIEVDTSPGGARVVRVLGRPRVHRGRPSVIVCDNGPEFRGYDHRPVSG